jgi:isoleucyl-tRNA synthetase
MSKRLRNYPDPELVLNSFGADALRLYLVTSPVVHAEDLRFKEEGLGAVVREVFLPWFNSFRFFVENVKS